ncbi:MAG: hypothetical protein K0Q79_1736 [Flavipsychrobacter sp.]|nr:hypothetical protein [Flavipsychrobacter sp.]
MNVKVLLLFILSVALCLPCAYGQVQDTAFGNNADLEKILDQQHPVKGSPGYYTSATFKATRIINGHSIENIGTGVLDFRIAHRFGQLNEGIKNLYGLDNAITKFSFDYGIADWLMIGVGRSSFEKEYDGYAKVKLMRQTVNGRHPLSISYLGSISARTMDVVNIPGFKYYLSNRLFYVNQLLIARKFNQHLSLQLMPTYIHYNLVASEAEPNDVFAIGAGGRLKLSKRIALTGEYYYTIPGHKLSGYSNSISLGADIETGGHVFQIFFTSSAGISERVFIGQTKGDVTKGDIHLGFNISRVFTIVRPKEFRDGKP